MTDATADSSAPLTAEDDAPAPVGIIDGDCLKTTRIEKVTSAIVAANLVLAFAVTLLLGFWLVRVFAPVLHERFYPIETASLLDAKKNTPRRRELATPETHELGLDESSVESLVQQIAVLAPSVADLEHLGAAKIQPHASPLAPQSTDHREKGAPGAIPPWTRWRIQWNVGALDEYARQLDHFEIELGCGGGKPLMDYARLLSTAKPAVRTGRGSDEQRIYMTGRDQDLLAANRQLLAKAGIVTEGRIILQFLSTSLCRELTKIEIQCAASSGHRLSEVRRTHFAIRRHEATYEFYVDDQEYLTTEL